MGKFLQIRLIATTPDPDIIAKEWPRLAALAFQVPLKLQNHGILEMARALEDGLQFMDWPQKTKEALAPGIKKIAQTRSELEKALADWDPTRANSLSSQLEDQLDNLERACPA